MTTAFDQHGINHMTVALSREMAFNGGKRHADADTLFIGGSRPSGADENALARFGLNKNYKIIYPYFDTADVSAGPIGFHAVVTDGLTESIILTSGRLWKRDRRSQAILLFPDAKIVVKMSSKGRLLVRGMAGQFHDHGYDLALESLIGRASSKPGHIPIVSSIGCLPTVLDVRTMAATFENAE